MSLRDKGDLLKSLLLGFEFSRSKTLAKVTLIDTRRQPATKLLEFDFACDSGRAPGLLLPAGVASEKASVLNFDTGRGNGLLLNPGHGPEEDALHASTAISKTLLDYYRNTGWLAKKKLSWQFIDRSTVDWSCRGPTSAPWGHAGGPFSTSRQNVAMRSYIGSGGADVRIEGQRPSHTSRPSTAVPQGKK